MSPPPVVAVGAGGRELSSAGAVRSLKGSCHDVAAQAAQGSQACRADAADWDACVACDVGVAAAGVVAESVDERARPGW